MSGMDNDTISRQAAIDALYHVDEYNGRSIEAIRNLPSAERRGSWVGIDDEPCEVWECDRCGHIVERECPPRFCEECGARMVEE